MSKVDVINKEGLVKWIENEEVHLIDVRNHNEQIQGSVENSIVIPLHLIPLELSRIRMMKGKIVFYCRTGARSAQACMFLAKNYVNNVFSLEGGIESWNKKN